MDVGDDAHSKFSHRRICRQIANTAGGTFASAVTNGRGQAEPQSFASAGLCAILDVERTKRCK
ncbi:hypothetical protein ACC741_39095, partial [Rhizobium johnstonii]|uniref:hypothetical protein n=1 Tax=Rhizobium johnstonii TaxID=3019933 RepID=UPI003F94AC34